MKFAFIVLKSVEKKYLYSGFNELKNSVCLFIPNNYRKSAKFLYKVGLSDSMISKLIFPRIFKKYITEKLQKKEWRENSEEICFIIYGRDMECYRNNILNYLKKEYPNSFRTVYFDDLISSFSLDIENIKKEFHAVYSFDQMESEKYSINWCIEPFTASRIKELNQEQEIKWDVTFIGNAKNRYEKIIRLYEELTDHGFKCDFHITNVPRDKRLYQYDIGYEQLEFEEMLNHCIQSRCIAELLQENAMSPTTRFSESVLLNKNLLTDASCFEKEENRPGNVIFFREPKEICFDRITVSPQINIDYYERLLSIKSMIDTIEQGLKQNN